MFNEEDFDGDTDMARAVNREVMNRQSGQRECYCNQYTICEPCAREY